MSGSMREATGEELRIVVAADGSGDCRSIQEAVDSIPPDFSRRTSIRVRAGVYREKLFIDRDRVSLIGEGAEKTVIRYGDHATKTFPNGEPYHTFHSFTALIGGDDFVAEGVSFVNDAGPGNEVGQAVAAYVDGDRAVFRRCRFEGCQDTLFTGPLPLRPVDRATFGGPREGAPRRPSRQYYENCYIEGDVDFIFGSATAVFDRCEIFSKRLAGRPEERQDRTHGWITAASTPEDAACGYVFLDCRLSGDAPPASVYLGRPWREFAQTVFIRCEMGAHIKPEGWHDWGKTGARKTVRYAEYGSVGPGASTERAEWSRRLTAAEAETFAPERVLAGEDGWNPRAIAAKSANE